MYECAIESIIIQVTGLFVMLLINVFLPFNLLIGYLILAVASLVFAILTHPWLLSINTKKNGHGCNNFIDPLS